MADRKDFDAAAMPHLDSVFRTAVALCGGRRDQAEDLAQAAMLKALEQFASFALGTNCKAWLLQILRNHWIDQLRRRKLAGPAVELDEQQLAARPQAEDEPPIGDLALLIERFSDEQVIRALQGLPEELRWTLLLTDVEGLSTDEAAEVLGVAPGTVKSRAWRARERLREKLAGHARELGFPGRR